MFGFKLISRVLYLLDALILWLEVRTSKTMSGKKKKSKSCYMNKIWLGGFILKIQSEGIKIVSNMMEMGSEALAIKEGWYVKK